MGGYNLVLITGKWAFQILSKAPQVFPGGMLHDGTISF
jgi:hypothetical protein